MNETRTIEIDFDVHKRIELERKGFSETPNAVLRRLLNIDKNISDQLAHTVGGEGRHWAGKGVTLPHGSELQMEYNGQVYTGRIENGQWLAEGKVFNSPSAAASGVAVTKDGRRTNLDGWLYWRVKQPEHSNWIRIAELRRSQHSRPPTRLNVDQQESGVQMHVQNEPHSDLPTEGQVQMELVALLSQRTQPISPSEAYRSLAEKFTLTQEQRNRLMPNGSDVHWENRVRFARRKLVDAGKIDTTLPRGKWALKSGSQV